MNTEKLSMTLQNAYYQTAAQKYCTSQDNEPQYLYFTGEIRSKCRKFLQLSYKNKSIHFASMANPHPEFLKIIREENIKIFVNSLMHLNLALQSGFRGEEIIFTASAMSGETMHEAATHQVIVNLDSVMQLEQWNRLYPHLKAGIRCNIGDVVPVRQTRGGYFIGNNSRLGLSTEEIRQQKGNREINGLHLYVGTDILDVNYFMNCYEELIRLAKYFPSLEFIDVGGGFGVKEATNDEFDFESYNMGVTKLMEDFSSESGKSIRLIIEPGRIIGAEAGFFACKVIDIKKRNNIQYIGVNASSVQFPRPLLYPDDSWHPVEIFSPSGIKKSIGSQKSYIFGCSTYSRDFLAREIDLPNAAINDIIVIGNAGSYCASSHLKFLGYPQAKEIFI